MVARPQGEDVIAMQRGVTSPTTSRKQRTCRTNPAQVFINKDSYMQSLINKGLISEGTVLCPLESIVERTFPAKPSADWG